MSEPRKVALIFGVSGQDGSYLSQLLLDRGYEVHGTSRDKELTRFSNLKALGIYQNVVLHSTALNDFRSVLQTISNANPSEIYNLAAQSSVGLSFEQPVETIDSSLTGSLNILEAVRFLRRPIKLYFACSSECFGDTGAQPADEMTSFRPASPYGVAKAAAHWLVANYRGSYDLFACSGILFNHESPLRPLRFVTQKVVHGAIDIALGKASALELGNLDISRDWGWAPEYVEAMWLMLQQDKPGDYVIATGQSHTLEEFVSAAFERVGLDWRKHVSLRKDLLRPTDIRISVGNPQRAKTLLGWQAQTMMQGVVARLVDTELSQRGAETNVPSSA
jgi:GDPmannose 4,6-dehydratase